MERLRLYDLFRSTSTNLDEVELASEGNILDICYCATHTLFAYASTDSLVYVRRFSEHGSSMSLVTTLHGHLNEVNCVRWLETRELWVTGGEDATIRIWSLEGQCIELICCHATVNTMCFDPVEGVLMAACHDLIKVYDMDDYRLVQQNAGHHDSIR